MRKYILTAIICLASAFASIAQDTTKTAPKGDPKTEYIQYKAKKMPTWGIIAKNNSESYIRDVAINIYDKYEHMRQGIHIANIRPHKKGKCNYVKLTKMVKTWGKSLKSKNFDLVVEINVPAGFEILSTQDKHNKLKINIIDKGAWK